MILFTLHRYVFRELLKVFLLASIAFTMVLSLGSILRPIQDYGVGPNQVPHLLAYFIPITLTFVLPISAMLACALVYGRLAHDKELDACRASGISLMTLVYPGICLAITVSIITLVLSFHIVPTFVHQAEKAIKANAKQILFRNIQRKGYYILPGQKDRFKIRADHADPENDVLTGVLILDVPGYKVEKVITAESAKVIIKSKENINEVTVAANNTYQVDDQGNQFYSEYLPVKGTFESLLSDKIKFQTIDSIKKIKANMLNFAPIRQKAIDTSGQLAIEILASQFNDKMKEDPQGYYQLSSSNRVIMINSPGCEIDKNKKQLNFIAPITVIEMNKQLQRTISQYKSDFGFLQTNEPGPTTSLVMILKNADMERRDGYKSTAPIPQRSFRNLQMPADIANIFRGSDLLGVLENMSNYLETEPSGRLLNKYIDLQQEIEITKNDIIAETHSRLVFGFGTIALIMIAIAFGIDLKGGHLLSAFGVSALPAAVLVIAVLAGDKLIAKQDATIPAIWGISLMWGTLIGLFLLTGAIYRKITRT